MRAIHDEEAGALVELVLHHIVGCHFHVDLDNVLRRLLGPGVQSVPGMSAPAIETTVAVHVAYLAVLRWRRELYR